MGKLEVRNLHKETINGKRSRNEPCRLKASELVKPSIKRKRHKKISKDPRRSFTNAQKDYIWLRDNGKKFEGECPVCNVQSIDCHNFIGAHIVAHSCGGRTHVDNGIAICGSCNSKMGTRNLVEFTKELYPTSKLLKNPELLKKFEQKKNYYDNDYRNSPTSNRQAQKGFCKPRGRPPKGINGQNKSWNSNIGEWEETETLISTESNVVPPKEPSEDGPFLNNRMVVLLVT